MNTAAMGQNSNPMALVRAIRRMERAGFTLSVDAGRVMVEPLSALTDSQRAYLRAHKGELLALLADAETLTGWLEQAGTAGLSWQEGTPSDWSAVYLLAVEEVLYGTGRMVSRLGRCYGPAYAPSLPLVAESRISGEGHRKRVATIPASPPVDTRVCCSECRHGQPVTPTDRFSWHVCAVDFKGSGGFGRALRYCTQWETRP